MGRTIIVGDVHGCADELDMLLDRVAASRDDRLVFVGDLVVKGPKPREVLAIARAANADVIRGNHEERLLKWRDGRRRRHGDSSRHGLEHTAKKLGEDDWALLEATPLWLELPDHHALVVHAGVVPGVPLENQNKKDLLHMRALDDAGMASADRRDGALWASRYKGPRHVVFGHNAVDGLQLFRHATGLDTGCVYGGTLTALVLDAGRSVPPLGTRKAHLRSVKARRIHCPI